MSCREGIIDERAKGGRVVHADISGAEPTVGLKLTPDCNLYNSRDLLITVALTQSYTHTHIGVGKSLPLCVGQTHSWF